MEQEKNIERKIEKVKKENHICLLVDIVAALVFLGVLVWSVSIEGCRWDISFYIVGGLVFAALAVQTFRRELRLWRLLK